MRLRDGKTKQLLPLGIHEIRRTGRRSKPFHHIHDNDAANAGALHRFQVGRDAGLGDIPVIPEPINPRPGGGGWSDKLRCQVMLLTKQWQIASVSIRSDISCCYRLFSGKELTILHRSCVRSRLGCHLVKSLFKVPLSSTISLSDSITRSSFASSPGRNSACANDKVWPVIGRAVTDAEMSCTGAIQRASTVCLPITRMPTGSW